MRDIIFPLEYLHSKNITHGDIRGQNILVNKKDKGKKKLLYIPSLNQG